MFYTLLLPRDGFCDLRELWNSFKFKSSSVGQCLLDSKRTLLELLVLHFIYIFGVILQIIDLFYKQFFQFLFNKIILFYLPTSNCYMLPNFTSVDKEIAIKYYMSCINIFLPSNKRFTTDEPIF